MKQALATTLLRNTMLRRIESQAQQVCWSGCNMLRNIPKHPYRNSPPSEGGLRGRCCKVLFRRGSRVSSGARDLRPEMGR